MEEQKEDIRIGVDIGGTFTDFVVYYSSSRTIHTYKLPSTPLNPAIAVLQGLSRVVNYPTGKNNRTHPYIESLNIGSKDGPNPYLRLVHGSTVATNALLERKGAHTALVTTQGFRDLFIIGRQNRPSLYDLTPSRPPPLIPDDRRYEVKERIGPQGEILQELCDSELPRLYGLLKSHKVDSVAICLLFSFANPIHEELITDFLRKKGFFVSASHEVLPEFREYERMSTTVINAYVSPVFDQYLKYLNEKLGEIALPSDRETDLITPIEPQGKNGEANPRDFINLSIMQSNGGTISVGEARKFGARCILSGPAGGVIGAKFIENLESKEGSISDDDNKLGLITFDMGGTSTDVSLLKGDLSYRSDVKIGGYPIRLPMLDIHTIGAGGGSIATIDDGGALRVGPQSVGADPGPACYGKGEVPTVTDANLVLGRLLPDKFLGGQINIYPERSLDAVRMLSDELGIGIYQTAHGIIEVANAHMERALRVISVEKGYNPQNFTLFSFGGAGGLHAANLAKRLKMPQVIISPFAATLSALGMIAANVKKDYVQTVMLPGDTPLSEIKTRIEPIIQQGFNEVHKEGISNEDILVNSFLDLRYRGQSYELKVKFDDLVFTNFHQAHKEAYGFSQINHPIDIVNIRVHVTGLIPSPHLQQRPLTGPDPEDALLAYRPVMMEPEFEEISIPFYQGELLNPGNVIHGPSIIVRNDTTILMPVMSSATVDTYENLLITIR